MLCCKELAGVPSGAFIAKDPLSLAEPLDLPLSPVFEVLPLLHCPSYSVASMAVVNPELPNFCSNFLMM
jgi:hypothetical protein